MHGHRDGQSRLSVCPPRGPGGSDFGVIGKGKERGQLGTGTGCSAVGSLAVQGRFRKIGEGRTGPEPRFG